MSTVYKDDNREAVQAFGLPQSGQTVTVIGGMVSLPLAKGHYRFHSSVDINIASGQIPKVTDLLLQANIDEYFYINDKTVVGVLGGNLSLTLMP